jgi:hypothetical protein
VAKKNKLPHRAVFPKQEKVARSGQTDALDERPRWSLRTMDIGGDWCFLGTTDHATLCTILRGLRQFEDRTWKEILGRRDHVVKWGSIIPAAQKRLREIEQDDVEELVSLHLDGTHRVWGIPDLPVLRLLWWDPDHRICPSPRK